MWQFAQAFGIVAQIRVALRINESESAEPERGADRDCDTRREQHRHLRLQW